MQENKEASEMLDSIIKNRRSVRSFKPESPSADQIEKIILAGLNAPYAALAVGDRKDFRRFFVITRQSAVRKDLELIVANHLKAVVKKINSLPARIMGITRKFSKFSERLKTAKLPDSPYIIIMAEYNGIPPVAPQALAHAAENMWLMATAEGLGFQLLSLFENMNKNKELCNLLNVATGEYSFLGCAIGIPKDKLDPVTRPDPKTITKWL